MKMISVTASIVLFRHTPQDLNKTLDSLTNQPEVSRIILVDNGGSDWANDIRDSRFHYIKAPYNIGFGRAHNLAIRQFADKSDYFIICNPDINFGKSTIKAILDEVENYPAGLYMPQIAYPDGSRQELCKLLPSPIDLFARRFFPPLAKFTDPHYLLQHADFNQPFFAPSLSGCFMFCRSTALIALDGFDERFFMYMEDVDLARRFADNYGTCYIPVATVCHEFQKDSYKKTKLLKYHIISTIKYFNKWGWFFDKGRRNLNKKCLSMLPTMLDNTKK
ncbi:glycosyltransferase [Vogesella sp. GCM10023246]|uniref:Glycosyltransferase family 2 protein n=1 Tax=Vogesella oryzagri TaxID=3160864 RepID=A0ABV1M852_9NEIS